MTFRTTLLLLGFSMSLTQVIAFEEFEASNKAFRRNREQSLRAEESWLTLVGLHWLKDGQNEVGSDQANAIVLPPKAPSRLGTFSIDGQRVWFRPNPGVFVTKSGKPIDGKVEVVSDIKGKAEVIAVGDFRLTIIHRGGRFAIRLKDNASPLRLGFRGLNWAPTDPKWVLEAKFEASGNAAKIHMETIIGTSDDLESPGFVVFQHEGKTYRLQAAKEGDKLWFVFRDKTAGETTAMNARQLEADMPGPDGKVILDFNKAVNLPCAYTNFATCPIAPKQNRLDFKIFAGELLYESATNK